MKNDESEVIIAERKALPILATGIGTRISDAASRIGTRSQAAQAAGVSDDMLYRYIREENPPPFTAMVGLSKASGVSLDYLASGEGPLYKDESVAEDGSPYKADEKPLQERLTAATNAILKAPESDRSEAGELAVIFVRDLVLLGALKADAASDVISHIASQLRSRRNTPATDI